MACDAENSPVGTFTQVLQPTVIAWESKIVVKTTSTFSILLSGTLHTWCDRRKAQL